jgi:hypothetical protein
MAIKSEIVHYIASADDIVTVQLREYTIVTVQVG